MCRCGLDVGRGPSDADASRRPGNSLPDRSGDAGGHPLGQTGGAGPGGIEAGTPGRWAMSSELVIVSSANVPATAGVAVLPVLVERAGAAGRFAWEEFFYAEHHNRHTQKAYMAAVKRFLAWAEGQGVELATSTPGMLGQYLTGLGGSPSKRNLHLAALRGFFDRLVQRHVVILNPAASVRGVKDQVIEGKTPEITLEQARTLLASIRVAKLEDDGQGGQIETPLLVGL